MTHRSRCRSRATGSSVMHVNPLKEKFLCAPTFSPPLPPHCLRQLCFRPPAPRRQDPASPMPGVPGELARRGDMPPRSWVDKDTGHRVWRLSDEANSGGFYFNINAYTPDSSKWSTPRPTASTSSTWPPALPNSSSPTHRADALDNRPHPRCSSRHGRRPQNQQRLLHCNRRGRRHLPLQGRHQHRSHPKLVDVPKIPNTNSISVVSVNADETLVAGTYIEGPPTGKEYGSAAVPAPAQPAGTTDNRVGSAAQGPHYQPTNKGQMMATRLAARLPLVLFTLRLAPGPNGEKPGDTQTPPSLHRLDQPSALLAHRSRTPHVLPRRRVGEG